MDSCTNLSLILSLRSKYCLALMEEQTMLTEVNKVHTESRSVGWGRPSDLSLWEAKVVAVSSRNQPGLRWKRTDFETVPPKHRFCRKHTS